MTKNILNSFGKTYWSISRSVVIIHIMQADFKLKESTKVIMILLKEVVCILKNLF